MNGGSENLTIEELTTRQLTGFVETGEPISFEVAEHLRALNEEQLVEVGATVPTEGESINPDRRQWIANLALRGSALIDLMVIPTLGKPGDRPDMSIKKGDSGSSQANSSESGRHTRASIGVHLANPQ